MNVAVVTGASMGLGEEFARQLGARGENLLLIARSGERLNALATELATRHGVAVHALPCDLAAPGAAAAIEQYLAQHELAPTWLINNAGLADAGPFEAMDHGRLNAQLTVNVVALTELTRRLLPALRRARAGRIINVASRAAFQPVPFFAVYAAGKAYVLSFSEALREELRGSGVRVTCLCPGPIATEFNRNNAIQSRRRHAGQPPAEVARMGLAGSDRGRAVVIGQGWWTILAQRLLPRGFVCRMAGRITRRDKEWAERA
jgi:short-subunit dehydrogenase